MLYEINEKALKLESEGKKIIKLKNNRLCLALTESTINKNIEIIKKYKKYINILELRADFLKSDELNYINKLPEMTELPVILTVRREKEGGNFCASEAERTKLIKNAVSGSLKKHILERIGLTSLEAIHATCILPPCSKAFFIASVSVDSTMQALIPYFLKTLVKRR